MFSQVIQNAENLASSVASMPAPPQAAPVITHVKTFSSSEVPALKSYASACSSFATSATKTVDAMLSAIDGGAKPASQKAELDGLVSQIDSLEGQADKTNGDLQGFRDQFNGDAADLQGAVGTLNAQVAGLQAQQQRYSKKLSDLKSREAAIRAVSYIPGIGLLAKAADEIASLITEQKTTEAAMSDASRQLSGVLAQQSQLRGTAAQIQQMENVIVQLANGTQNTTNTVNMLKQQLDSEDTFLNGAGDAPKLFLTATKSSLSQLETLVS